jgi:hypothetical protein
LAQAHVTLVAAILALQSHARLLPSSTSSCLLSTSQAYSDPNCLESSSYGFMSFKLNTCTPAWMFSYESQKLYLKNTAYQKESLIFTATDLFR